MSSIDETAVINAVRLAEQSAAPATPASGYGLLYILSDGSIYFKNDAGTIFGPFGSGQQSVLFAKTSDTTVANTVTPTDLIGSGVGSATLAADLLQVGTTIRLDMAGIISTTGTPTFDFSVALGGTELVSTGAHTLGDTITNVGWRLFLSITCRSTGATGTVSALGFVRVGENLPGLVLTGEATVDTEGTLAITGPGEWGTADSLNTATCKITTIEHLSVAGLS